jgi:dCMP deaminase
MNLILDGLYEQHVRYLKPVGAEKTIADFAEANLNSTKDLYAVTNIIKTSAVCGYTYRQCYDEIRKKLAPTVIPDRVVVAAVKIMYNPMIKRDIYKEVAVYKYQVSENMVTDRMVESVKNTGLDGYSIDEPAVESWDEYYYGICKQVARNSKCLSRRIGAILVRDKCVVASGYNGPAAGIPRCDERWNIDDRFKAKYKSTNEKEKICPRRVLGFKSGDGLEVCVAVHSEENAILMCAKEGISAEGTTMYMTCGIPCKECMNKIIQVGVKEIVVTTLDIYHDASLYLLENSVVKIRLFDFIE